MREQQPGWLLWREQPRHLGCLLGACLWPTPRGGHRLERAELTCPRPHGQAGESLGLGLGGQRARVLEGVPQVWTGRPRPIATDIWEGLAWVRQPLRHSLGPGGGLASAGSRAGGRRRKPGSISLGGRDRPPRPQIAAPGRPVRSAGSTGQAARPGPPPAVGWPKTRATVLSTCPPPSSVCTWGGAGVAPGDCVQRGGRGRAVGGLSPHSSAQ